VLNTVLVEKAQDKLCWHTLYLTALKVYNPALEPQHRARVAQWREKVRQDLETCKQDVAHSVYLRSRRFDPLLGFLFPEMRDLLARPLPGEQSEIQPRKSSLETRNPSRQSPSKEPPVYQATGPTWLKGKDLEDWKRANPEAAAKWELWLKNQRH